MVCMNVVCYHDSTSRHCVLFQFISPIAFDRLAIQALPLLMSGCIPTLSIIVRSCPSSSADVHSMVQQTGYLLIDERGPEDPREAEYGLCDCGTAISVDRNAPDGTPTGTGPWSPGGPQHHSNTCRCRRSRHGQEERQGRSMSTRPVVANVRWIRCT